MINPLYPIKPPYNSHFSEIHLKNFLEGKTTIIYYQGGGGGKGDVIFPENEPNFNENNRQNFKKLSKQCQFEMLYIYMKDKAIDNIYTKEGNRLIANYFNCGKDLISERFNDLLNLGWISEIIEMNRKYKLIREDN